MFNVKNRSASMVVYTIPEDGIRREFMPGETKKITKEELDKLIFQPGGRELIAGFLQIQSQEELDDLNIPVEDEDFMNEQQIADLIVSGSYDAFLDCLDFAPTGVMDLVKKFAIEIPMTDTRKIAALKEKTGFDVAKALEMNRLDKEDEESAAPAKKERRVKTAEEIPQGRRTAPKYKVVNKE